MPSTLTIAGEAKELEKPTGSVTVGVLKWVPTTFSASQVAYWWANAWHKLGTKYMLRRHEALREFWPWRRTKVGEWRIHEKQCDKRMKQALKRYHQALGTAKPTKHAF